MPANTWLEVALNGGWTRALQPRIPVSVEEIVVEGVACAREGAAIVHLHAYDPATGRQHDDADVYARIIEGIRAEIDVIVYPTIESSTPPGSELNATGAQRYRAVESLARRGLLEWSVVDPGSVNLSTYPGIVRGRPGSVYLNPESDVRTGLALAERHGFHPSYAVYEPGFLRLGAALAARYAKLKRPVYRFMFSEIVAFGFTPRAYALDAYLALLNEHAPGALWMIAGLMVDLTEMIPLAVQRGGHVRTGLEDAPLGCKRSNAELVAASAAAIRKAGGTLASAADVRQALSP